MILGHGFLIWLPDDYAAIFSHVWGIIIYKRLLTSHPEGSYNITIYFFYCALSSEFILISFPRRKDFERPHPSQKHLLPCAGYWDENRGRHQAIFTIDCLYKISTTTHTILEFIPTLNLIPLPNKHIDVARLPCKVNLYYTILCNLIKTLGYNPINSLFKSIY